MTQRKAANPHFEEAATREPWAFQLDRRQKNTPKRLSTIIKIVTDSFSANNFCSTYKKKGYQSKV